MSSKKEENVELDEVAELKEELEAERQKAEDYLDRLKRTMADYDNYQKRAEKEKEEMMKRANELLILDVLRPLEDMERARASDVSGEEDLKKGLELIYNDLWGILEKCGLSAIPTEGQPFDPFLHEAVMQEESDKYDDGIIIEELQRGYKLHDKIIRHSKVKVAKKKEEANDMEE